MAADGGSEHTMPVFLVNNQMPAANEKNYTVAEICSAAEKTSGYESIEGAQRIRGLWRLYPKTQEGRIALLTRGLVLRGTLVTPKDTNPFLVRENDPNEREVPTTKLIVGDVPISCANEEITASLNKLKVKTRSKVIEERGRDERGKLTRWKTGRRIVYIEIPDKVLPRQVNIGIFRATLYYKEMRIPTCSKCLEQGHHASTCEQPVKCKQCFRDGHVAGSPDCQMTPPLPPPATSSQTSSPFQDVDTPAVQTSDQAKIQTKLPFSAVVMEKRGALPSRRSRSCTSRPKRRSSRSPSPLPVPTRAGKTARIGSPTSNQTVGLTEKDSTVQQDMCSQANDTDKEESGTNT